ncbi:coiled-coil domain-containing protein 88B-like [Seriola lalandi dorsalis]|uniref:coiled-coil domain-containing protein 88B-like n=1 Tax=Seriola lalandi dorsalis TaxID=1841481 RepID=UPI000C6F723E|nr:coiled-coil domain-containing protein 88B-like [Seriola lalandi dorsalis]XP_056242810.1 coiled-coil domain-containing protein 88B [Seriola aureovittata]XP_056242811.1 coiled-coil domain-containing protein 88B [Seriola aureovittata]XP_056242812.1 coiled-coil domain-containing protein 88B [Seriola aureovittata]
MSLRAKSHTDLQTAGKSSLDHSLYKSFSMSSSNVSRGGRFGNGATEEVKGLSRPTRRPVRVVRPVSAINSNGSFLQINHLQGELVRKRKECEDLRKENKFLSNEIHMERIMMRTENELTMRNLRNLNQELQAQVKELKQKLYQSQQRATLCSRAADDAEESRGESEKIRALAEARALGCQRDREAAEADRSRLSEELQRLKKEHTDLQLLLAQTEKNYFETKLKLDRVSGEKQALLQENRSLEGDRDDLRHKLRQVTQENVQIKDSEMSSRRRAMASEEESKKANQAQREAEAERRLAEKERQERTAECLSWREKHQEISDRFRAQEDLKALRQNKACQANIKSYFLCMTESDQRVKILKNPDGTPRNFTEGDPVFISTPESSPEEPERTSSRTMFRISAPHTGRDPGPSHFDELPAVGGDRPDSAPPRRSRRVVDYFWIPTDQE